MNSGQVWVNKQVIGGEKGQGRLEGGKDKLPPTPGRVFEGLCTGGRTHRRDTVFRGLSGATLPTKIIYMYLPRGGWVRGAARWARGGGGAGGDVAPSSP